MANSATGARRMADADLCVVGAGIVGLAHAHEGRRRGLRVVLLERERCAVGASVRNFGHAFLSGVSDGEDLECALRARERWLDLGARARIPMWDAGTLVVARAEDELAVLEGAAANPRRGAVMVNAIEAGRLAPIPTAELVGALHGKLDLRVDPRSAVAGLARLLEEDPGARVEWGTAVHEIAAGEVSAGVLTVRAPRIVICPGPGYAALPPRTREGLEQLTLCKLQMLRIAAPRRRVYAPALVTGLSTIRYPAFTAQRESEDVRRRLLAERPELIEAGIHLLITQLPDGDLIVGDTHAYGDTLTPFHDEHLDELLLAEARRLLGAGRLEVRQRWLGVYPTRAAGHLANSGDHFLVTTPFSGARLVEVASGLGMTMALGHAASVLDELEREQAQAAGRAA
ncbi:MAG: TIGR03364 family FAD-dependent oxidoreductase [Solirubrobacteraceae bacterium]